MTRALNKYQGAPLPPLYMVVTTGQSLDDGDYGTPPLSTSPVGGNLQLYDSSGTYDITNPTAGTLSLASLYSPIRADKYSGGGGDTSAYPVNIGGEAPVVATVNTLATLTGSKFVAGTYGQGGAGAAVIGKGGSGNAYAATLFEVRAANRLAAALGYRLVVWAVLLTHGEYDAASAVGYYQGFVSGLQCNYQQDIQAITGQGGTIPLILSQQSAFPYINGGSPNSTQAQYMLVRDNPGRILGSCTKMGFAQISDRAHLQNTGYRLLGENNARPIYQYLTGGAWSWVPLLAKGFARTGNQLTITFNVPTLPLAWDLVNTAPHGAGTRYGDGGAIFAGTGWTAGKGFGFWQGGFGGTPVGVSSAVLSGNAIILNAVSTFDTVEYGMTPDLNTPSAYTMGFPDGRCGSLLDSSVWSGLTGTNQPSRLWAFVQGGF